MIWTIMIVRCIVVNLMIVMIQNQTAFSSSMLLFTYTTWKKHTPPEKRGHKNIETAKKIKFGWRVPKHGEKKNLYNNDVDQPEWWSPPSRCWWDRGWGRRRQGWAGSWNGERSEGWDQKSWDAKIHKATEYCDKMTNKSASIKDVIAQNFHWQSDWLVYMGNFYMTALKS